MLQATGHQGYQYVHKATAIHREDDGSTATDCSDGGGYEEGIREKGDVLVCAMCSSLHWVAYWMLLREFSEK